MKWVTTKAGIEQFNDISSQLILRSLVRVQLIDGTSHEGLQRQFGVENNGPASARPGGAGQIHLQTIHGDLLDIKLTEIASVKDVWEERHDAYVKAGLLRIVDDSGDGIGEKAAD